MFGLITRAFNQSKPFLTDSYQATKSGVTAGLYVIKAGADAVATAAYTAKAVVKTAYYTTKHAVLVGYSAYDYYTAETPKAKTPKDKTEESSENITIAGFNFDAYDERLDTYNEAWDAATKDLLDTGSEFVSDVYTPVCDATSSLGQVAYYTVDSLGHSLKAAGESLLLVKSTAEYFLSSESLVKDKLGDASEYELVEVPKSPVFSDQASLLAAVTTAVV